MKTTYQAVFEHGAFRVVQPFASDISEGESVWLIVETVESTSEMPDKQTSRQSWATIPIVRQLEKKLLEWETERAAMVEQFITEILTLTDEDCLDLMRSRAVEQEVLNILDEPESW